LKLLVTGGAGFIGSNFVLRTLETRPSADLIVLDALTYAGKSSNLASAQGDFEFIHGDIRDADLVDELTEKVDVVVNFAAESHNDNSLRDPSLFFDTNVMGTLNLARAAVRHDVHLHHISTDEVFGDLPLDSEEEFKLESSYRPSSPYSASKASSDHVVRSFGRSFGLRYTISNCSNNYGPNQDWEKLIPATILSILESRKPKVYGTGQNVRDWIHVHDHVDAIWTILDSGASSETFLVGARDRVRNIDLVQAILASFNRDPGFIDFVDDRPGHDLRYALDPSSTANLGWSPRHKSVLAQTKELLEIYGSLNSETKI
jgi:dTDP-glucose 4,6-dehydratase